MNAEKQGREFKVNKENDNAEVHQGMWGSDVVHFLHQKHQRGQETGFCYAESKGHIIMCYTESKGHIIMCYTESKDQIIIYYTVSIMC